MKPVQDPQGEEGRSCPIHYRYRPEQLGDFSQTWDEDVLYVVGGLYGNLEALNVIEAMAAAERVGGRSVRLVFNGDFNWFNAGDELFAAVNGRVLGHDAMLGNVEYELAHPSPGAGCGCAYPEFVDAAVVERSNRIMARLQTTAARHNAIRQQLASLPRWRCGIFGGLKVLVLHGDPESLAGWGLAQETLRSDGSGAAEDRLRDWFQRTGADLIASTHTCLPLIWSGEVDGRSRRVINNGSAGMGNLAGDPRGLVTRISRLPPLEAPVAQASLGPVDLGLMPVEFDLDSWMGRFDSLWPPGSEAALSYRNRLMQGTSLAPEKLYIRAGVSS